MTRLENPIEIKFYFRFIRIDKTIYLKEVIKNIIIGTSIYS